MNFWKVILATVVIFGAGVFTGGLLVNSVQRPHFRSGHRPFINNDAHPPPEAHDPQSHTNVLTVTPRPPRPPEILGDKFVQQLDDALQLTPDQRASIQKIITDGQENHAIWTNNSAQMHAVIQDVRHRVREELTADQQKLFEELMKRVPHHQQNSTNAPANLSATNAAASYADQRASKLILFFRE